MSQFNSEGAAVATIKLIGSKHPEGLAQFPDKHSQMRCSDNVLLLSNHHGEVASFSVNDALYNTVKMFLCQIHEPAGVGEWPRKAFLPQLPESLPAEAEKIKFEPDECS